MSTKTTLASVSNWILEEELSDGSTWLSINGPLEALITIDCGKARVRVELPPGLLDTIAELHVVKSFPHQRRE